MPRIRDSVGAWIGAVLLLSLVVGPIGLFIVGLALPVVAVAGVISVPIDLVHRAIENLRR